MGRKCTEWIPDWDDDGHGSRYTDRVEFVLSVGDPGEAEIRRMQDELVSSVAVEVPEVGVETARASSGRGASSGAIALIVSLAGAPGAAYATWQVFARVFNFLRSRGGHPTMSIGAIRHLCLADLFQSHPDLRDLDVLEVVTTEVSPPGPPSDLDHAGRDMFMAIFVKRDNSCTWIYLVDSYGKILHTGQGEPLTGDLAFGTLPPETWSAGRHQYLADPDR